MNSIKVTLGGEERELRFGLKVIGDCIAHNGQSPDAFFASLSNSFQSTPLIIYYGAKYHVERAGGIVDFALLDVYDWIEEEGIGSEMVDNITRVFIRSMYDNVPEVKENLDSLDDEVKKNLIGT